MVSTRSKIWLVFWISSLLVIVASAGAPSRALFSDRGRGAEVEPADAEAGVVSINGATVQVVAVSADAADIVVSVRIGGVEDSGPEATIEGFASLIDANGTHHLEIGGRINGRILELRFSSADPGPGPWKLQIDGLGIGESGRTARELGDVRLPVDISSGEPALVVKIGSESEFAGLKLAVNAVRRSDHRAVLEGSILKLPDGIDFKDFSFLGSELVSREGTRVTINEARIGLPNAPAAFELIVNDDFPAASDGWTLNVPVRGRADSPGELGPTTGVLSVPLARR